MKRKWNAAELADRVKTEARARARISKLHDMIGEEGDRIRHRHALIRYHHKEIELLQEKFALESIPTRCDVCGGMAPVCRYCGKRRCRYCHVIEGRICGPDPNIEEH